MLKRMNEVCGAGKANMDKRVLSTAPWKNNALTDCFTDLLPLHCTLLFAMSPANIAG